MPSMSPPPPTLSVLCARTTELAAIATGVACPSTAKISRPYSLWSQSNANDLTGTALPTMTTQTSVNATEDPVTTTVMKVSGSETYTKTATNQYWPDDTSCTD